MISHPDVYQKLVASRHAQILHEIQLLHMSKHVKQRPTFFQLTVSSLGRLLIVLGSYMQRTGQKSEASIPSS